jgi:hypothetical protein
MDILTVRVELTVPLAVVADIKQRGRMIEIAPWHVSWSADSAGIGGSTRPSLQTRTSSSFSIFAVSSSMLMPGAFGICSRPFTGFSGFFRKC